MSDQPVPPPHRRRWRWRSASLGTFALAGALFFTSAITADGQELRAESVTDLPTVVRQQDAETKELLALEARLTAEIDRLSRGAGGKVGDRLQRRLAQLRPAAGLSEVTGEGLRVVLDDAPQDDLDRAYETGTPEPKKLIVHQQDIQAVVNALWVGGARAISLMDRRVITTTGIKCVGSTVVLHRRPYSPPYRIVAIGDPQQMQAALDASDWVRGYRSQVITYGLTYEQESAQDLEVPAYQGSTTLSVAEPLPMEQTERDD